MSDNFYQTNYGRLLNALKCPACGRKYFFSLTADDEWICENCKHTWPVQESEALSAERAAREAAEEGWHRAVDIANARAAEVAALRDELAIYKNNGHSELVAGFARLADMYAKAKRSSEVDRDNNRSLGEALLEQTYKTEAATEQLAAAVQRAEAAEATAHDLREQWHNVRSQLAEVTRERDAHQQAESIATQGWHDAAKRVERLEEFARDYGDHFRNCCALWTPPMDCDCGYEERRDEIGLKPTEFENES